MADERAAEQPDTDEPGQAISQPHDKYFQRVFSNEQDAASLLRTCVPRPLADTLKWSTLALLRGRFVADDWRRNETDLLYSVEREGTETPVLVYVLLEHQSTPDQWLRLRLLGVYERLAQADWGIDRDVYDIKSGGVVPESFFIGQLAESWSQPDATTYVFKIRKGVHWHDKAPMNGRELTAKDIEYNWHRLATLGSGFTEPPARFGSIPNVPFESITATDDWTVVFKLKQPMLSALKIILDDAWTWILPPEVIKEHGDVADWRNVVGTGPYMLTEWIDGSSMTWKKNPDYWGYDEKYPENRLAYIDELKGLFILDEATRLSALRTGKVGFGGMGTHWQMNSLDDFESLQKTTDLELWPFYQRSNYAFSLNVTEPPFTDIRVRRAMQMALDLETISETFFKGFASWQPQGLIAEHQIGWSTPFETWPEEIKQYYRYDPEGAEALLDEAGYRRGADGIRFKTILSHSFPQFSDYGEISIAYWDAIGVDVELVITDGPTWNTQVKDQSYGGLTYGSAAMPYDPVKTMIRYYKDSPWNPSGATDPAYDALYEPALAATTAEEAQMLVKEMDTMHIKELWTLWGPVAPAFFASQPWLKGYNGEVVLGDMNGGGALFARLWIDQELKEAMGH